MPLIPPCRPAFRGPLENPGDSRSPEISLVFPIPYSPTRPNPPCRRATVEVAQASRLSFFMSSLLQIQANRRNAQKSTGPRSVEGKAISRFNALQSGIDAQSQVIRGEDPAVLDALTAEYHQRFLPDSPEIRSLVDTLVHAEWLQRRLRTVEAQLWEHLMAHAYSPDEDSPLGDAFAGSSQVFVRLQRRMDAAGRTYLRTLEALQKAQAGRPGPQPPAPGPQAVALAPQAKAQTQPNQPPTPQIGFVPSTAPAPDPNASGMGPGPSQNVKVRLV